MRAFIIVCVAWGMFLLPQLLQGVWGDSRLLALMGFLSPMVGALAFVVALASLCRSAPREQRQPWWNLAALLLSLILLFPAFIIVLLVVTTFL